MVEADIFLADMCAAWKSANDFWPLALDRSGVFPNSPSSYLRLRVSTFAGHAEKQSQGQACRCPQLSNFYAYPNQTRPAQTCPRNPLQPEVLDTILFHNATGASMTPRPVLPCCR